MRQNYLHHVRQCAIAQQRLMQRCAVEKLAAEQHKPKGLVILAARYGRNPSKEASVYGGDSLGAVDGLVLDGDDAFDAAAAAAAGSSGASDESSAVLSPQSVDVTVPLQFFVNDSQLRLHATSKAGLLGFYNPLVGEYHAHDDVVDASSSAAAAHPQLYVRYAYDGAVFEATFDDEQQVVLPSRYAQAMGGVGHVY